MATATAPYPPISVVIPTCNRPDDVQRCLETLTRVIYPSWDILLIDQSDDTRTEAVAEAFVSVLDNLTYRRVSEKGVSRARNVGIEAASGEIIAFLDDDCTVEDRWLEKIADAFARQPQAALLVGTVKAVAHAWQDCFIPAHEVKEERIVRGRRAFPHLLGCMSASMCLYRARLQRAILFDSNLGPGTRFFRSSEDWDYVYRMLAGGYGVIKTPAVAVEHYGARDYKSGAASRLVRDCSHSDGAVDMKLLRCGDSYAPALVMIHIWRCLNRINMRRVILRQGSSGLAYIAMYIRGLCASFQLGVDRRQCMYVVADERVNS